MDKIAISIQIKEMLSADWSAWFDGVTVTTSKEGFTHLTACVPDQAAVRGLLIKLWDLNLTIISFDYKVLKDSQRKPLDRKIDPKNPSPGD